MTAWLEVAFHDYWHIGSGRGGGPGVDAHVRRTSGGLPYVPGRTLKGVLRDAARLAARLDWIEDREVEWFGTGLDSPRSEDDAVGSLERARFKTVPGGLAVSSAVIGWRGQAQAWERLAAEDPARVRPLFEVLHTTALEDGVARKGSLRAVEVAVPMVLWARLESSASSDPWPALGRCLPLVSAIGGGKRRGLGRVALRLVGEEEGI